MKSQMQCLRESVQPRMKRLVSLLAALLVGACGGGAGGVGTSSSSGTTQPDIVISSPSSSGSYSTSNATVGISGTVSDNASVAEVTWSNDRGGSGTATGTTVWTTADIPLQTGKNVITVTAHDVVAHTRAVSVVVTTTYGSVPAAASYVHPGTVGFLGDPTSLTQYLDGGAAPAGCSWQSYGLRCDQDNLSLDHVHIKGGLYWTGSGNLTITNSIVEGSDAWYGIYAATATNNAGSQITVSDSTLRWTLDSTEPPGEDVGPVWTRGTQALIIQRCDISSMPQGIDPGEGSLIEDNWIHDLFQNNPPGNPSHLDGIFSQGGGDIIIQRNFIDVPIRGDTTAALFIQNRGGTDTGIKIYANYINGGAYILRNQTGIDVDVVNNTFGTGLYGDVGDLTGYPGTYGIWLNNVHDDGTTVPRPN
jgi:hypothetical protein